jgi:putative ATP-dependent endonuclease of OLD family
LIELESYSVAGLRSLTEVADIPVREPTIVTGANDGGKTSALFALDFLLGEKRPDADDYTVLGPQGDETAPLHYERIVVTGSFSLDSVDQQTLGLDPEVTVRRIAERESGATRYEYLVDAPVDERFQDLDGLKQQQLANLANEVDVEPTGPKNRRDAWLGPLKAHATGLDHAPTWIPAPAGLVERLPELMFFSSTEEPDPEGQIYTALKEALKGLLADPKLLGPVRKVESKVRVKLAAKANDLCAHVSERCPELDSITVRPEVTFTDGFRHVEVMASRPGGAEIPLNNSGAGRRRRVNLAIWEWTGDLLKDKSSEDRATVIAYDEPDTHLDYAHQRELVDLVQKQCANSGVRMMVATHSLNLIDRVDMEDVVHLRLDGEVTAIERIVASDHQTINEHLQRVSEAMGLRNSVLLHERTFLGVEGPTETQTFPVLFRLATGMSLQSAGVALIAGNGNDGALNVVRFLKEHGRNLSFVIVDADSSDKKLFREDKLKSAGIASDEVHFLGTRELEDLFSDAQWATAANAHWPKSSPDPWTVNEFASMRASEKFSQAIENAARGQSLEAPQSKVGYLAALVQDLETVEEVPDQLVKVFRELAELDPLDSNGDAD